MYCNAVPLEAAGVIGLLQIQSEASIHRKAGGVGWWTESHLHCLGDIFINNDYYYYYCYNNNNYQNY